MNHASTAISSNTREPARLMLRPGECRSIRVGDIAVDWFVPAVRDATTPASGLWIGRGLH
jgi:hypothetical protein